MRTCHFVALSLSEYSSIEMNDADLKRAQQADFKFPALHDLNTKIDGERAAEAWCVRQSIFETLTLQYK